MACLYECVFWWCRFLPISRRSVWISSKDISAKQVTVSPFVHFMMLVIHPYHLAELEIDVVEETLSVREPHFDLSRPIWPRTLLAVRPWTKLQGSFDALKEKNFSKKWILHFKRPLWCLLRGSLLIHTKAVLKVGHLSMSLNACKALKSQSVPPCRSRIWGRPHRQWGHFWGPITAVPCPCHHTYRRKG